MPFTFVLNDEEKVNSYGFRTLNKGIDLKRFKKNPVLLDFHTARGSVINVIGRWTNIRVEGTKLLADAEFDEEDEVALKAKGKVERGFVKGCSMGLDPDRSSFELEPVGTWVLKKCELMEASIVAIPSNANAVKLMSKEGIELDAEIIELCLSQNTETFNQNEKVNMKKLILSMGALHLLALRDTEDTAAVESAVNKLALDHTDLLAKYTALEAKVKESNEANAKVLVKAAIVEGKLTADQEEDWTKLATDNFEAISKTLSTMKGTTSLAAQIENAGKSEVKTQDDFFKLSAEAQEKFKTEHPAEFNAMFPVK